MSIKIRAAPHFFDLEVSLKSIVMVKYIRTLYKFKLKIIIYRMIYGDLIMFFL